MSACPGCIPPIPEGFDSPDPTMRLAAIADAGDARDEAAIPELIRQLESTDPGARLLAIRSLQRITGETFGYDYAAPRWERSEAVERWRDWYAAGESRDDGRSAAD
ncbi:MAG: HEAT repeat domain-containing protein [Phycisphaeraceae bacterium]|nr:MAG: HEAT repeat domain-containing protein [Phycisphaeraceae bacterium]